MVELIPSFLGAFLGAYLAVLFVFRGKRSGGGEKPAQRPPSGPRVDSVKKGDMPGTKSGLSFHKMEWLYGSKDAWGGDE